MIEQIISKGHYDFVGDIKDLKRRIGSFQIIKTEINECFQNIEILVLLCEFSYHGHTHKVRISKDFMNKELLHIEYKGIKNDSR